MFEEQNITWFYRVKQMMFKSRENISSCPMLEGFKENWSFLICLNQYITTSQACQCLLHFYMMIVTINPPTTYQNICFHLCKPYKPHTNSLVVKNVKSHLSREYYHLHSLWMLYKRIFK
jgi:arginyl-tRNA--protein-N-Asp/Glu arginylyltransferase